jgi:hypothetical protein
VSRAPPRTPEPVEGRKHTDIQTDAYLEELTDTVPEADNGTQTDAFLDRPPTPLFVPQKAGLDATTQIADGDLFDFDFEVRRWWWRWWWGGGSGDGGGGGDGGGSGDDDGVSSLLDASDGCADGCT